MKAKALVILAAAAWLCPRPACAQAQADVLKRIDVRLQQMMKDWQSPGLAVAIVKDDAVVFARGYGVRELGKPETVDENTLFAVGSQTKAFTAAALAILVDEGKLQWDDPVSKYLPQFQLSDPELTRQLTIRDCLTHRTGLDPLSAQFLFTDSGREEILRRYRFAPAIAPFRSSFEYNNILFLLAGQVIPAVTGTSWDDFVRERLFKPLGMTRSNTSIRGLRPGMNVAAAHEIVNGQVQPMPLLDVDNYAPAGAINSSALEMAQWLRLQLNDGRREGKAIVSAEAMRAMQAPQIPAAFGQFADVPFVFTYPVLLSRPRFLSYGLGWFVQEYRGKILLHHGGDVDGQRCQAGFIPDMRLGIVVFSNLHPATLVEAALFSIVDEFLGGDARDWSGELLAAIQEYRAKAAETAKRRMAMFPGGGAPALPLEKYAGAYESDAYGRADVACADGRLILRLGRVTAPLRPVQGNMFMIDVPSTLGRIPLMFAVGGDGSVNQVTLYTITDFKRVLKK